MILKPNGIFQALYTEFMLISINSAGTKYIRRFIFFALYINKYIERLYLE